MQFLSDTTAPVHPKIFESLSSANAGYASSYGEDALSQQAQSLLSEKFESEVSVWFTSSGTAANALALSILCPAYKAVICHREAHIQCDERGAPEFFTGGAKLSLLDGDHAKISPDGLRHRLSLDNPDHVHETPSAVLSLSNLTECGAAYTSEEIRTLANIAHNRGLSVHLDGARIANALVHLDATPADMTWRAGVDALCFGATKNGAMGCEAIILFGDARERFEELLIRAKRGGHMPPKQRFLAAQMIGILQDDLWKSLALSANQKASGLSQSFTKVEGARLLHPVQGNEVFVELPDWAVTKLREAGAQFYDWPFGGYRFVCSWDTPDLAVEQVDDLLVTHSR